MGNKSTLFWSFNSFKIEIDLKLKKLAKPLVKLLLFIAKFKPQNDNSRSLRSIQNPPKATQKLTLNGQFFSHFQPKSLVIFYHTKADFWPRLVLRPCPKVPCHFLGPPMADFGDVMEFGRPWLPISFKNYTFTPTHSWIAFWPFPQGPWVFQYYHWDPQVLKLSFDSQIF